MTLESIVGQEKAIKNLEKAVLENQVAHAYLFEGAEGLGKKALALKLAAALVCFDHSKRPCGKCNSCLKINSGNHPGIKIIEEAGTIKVDEVRELIKDIQLKPYEGSHKVYIICDADKMNIQGQNALLKTLEEPPAYATLILLTTKKSSLLPTIISRCQSIKLSPVSSDRIKSYLIQEKDMDPDRAQMLAALSEGIIGKALDLLSNEDFYKRREDTIDLCNALMGAKVLNILEYTMFFEEQKIYVEQILDLMVSWYRDVFVYKETGNIELITNVDKKQELDLKAGRIDFRKLRDIIFIIENAKNNLKSNVQFHLNIEVMLLNIQEVLSKW
ncbi:DNA polymerase III subunit delta' [Alkaliphilus oremlandii]|uniref:DNA polymerase III subunit delta' n=1 Tax=Alkaliphilus oremlandii (strain OhILAs) TaxID=350688 RepID=A8MEG1_ALKOO|nr:DNA polymerase III subunit delta' [Alkaliphilus oremlandii]ABW17632.1 DNA polymerase III, delta prime subunit [Alkaliphilus oremlandii OhILAs]